jgi:hypothetical protein
MIFGKYEWSGLIPYNGDNNTADLKISVTSKFGLDLFYTVSVPNAVVQLYAYRANSKTGLVGFASPMTIDNYALLQGVNVQDSTEATLCFWYKSESDKECVKKTIQGPKIGFEINSSSVSFDINASQLLPQQTKTYKKYLVVTNQGDMKINVYSHDVMKRMGNHSLPFSYFEINPHSNAPIPVEAVVSGTECHDSTTVLGVSLCKSDPNCAYKKEIVAITRCNEAG